MNKQTIKKEAIIESISKMKADKEIVYSYIKGKISLQEVNKKGIRFANPL